MLHLVHLPSGRIINVGDPLENGFARATNSCTWARDAITPCVRVADEQGFIYALVEGRKFHEYEVIGDSNESN